jgi:hypothetical protein
VPPVTSSSELLSKGSPGLRRQANAWPLEVFRTVQALPTDSRRALRLGLQVLRRPSRPRRSLAAALLGHKL